jgi:hypothetical protein
MRFRTFVLGTFFTTALISSPTVGAGEKMLNGFDGYSGEARVIDPDFAQVGADQDVSNGSYYGIALYDLGKKLATFLPEGETEQEIALSSQSHNDALLKMIKDAKAANKNPDAKTRQHLVLVGGEIHVIEVAKDDPKALKAKVAALVKEAEERKVQSSDEFKERVENKRKFATEIPAPIVKRKPLSH